MNSIEISRNNADVLWRIGSDLSECSMRRVVRGTEFSLRSGIEELNSESTKQPGTNLKLQSFPADFDSLVRIHHPAAIHDEVASQNAMALVNKLTSLLNPTTGQLLYLDTLTILIERYEDETEGINPQGVDALTVLRYLMEARGMNASDLGRLLGDRSLGTKLLNGERALSKVHLKTLGKQFHVSPAVLLG